jgi:beta-glucosidase
VTERALREIYLPPFEAAVKESGTWSVMASYNRVNGTFASENSYTLREILRKEWGFKGLVMSDWFGLKSTVEAVNAGLDLEMPGPTTWRGAKLLKAVQEGEVVEDAINECVRRVLELIQRAGAFERPDELPEQAIDKPEHRATIRQAAAEGIVLLKNEGSVLPIDRSKVKKLAIIGPNAKTARIMGGGSARVNAHYVITPYESIHAKAGSSIEIGYEIGCTNHKYLPLIDPAWIVPGDGNRISGLAVEFYNTPDLTGRPVSKSHAYASEQMWIGKAAPEVNADEYSARLMGVLTLPEGGRYSFSLVSVGLSRLYIDDELVVDNWGEQKSGDGFFGMGSKEVTGETVLTTGKPYQLRIEVLKKGNLPFGGVRIGCLPPVPSDSIDRATALAARSDLALLFVGLSEEWESEGFDRPDLELVGDQVALIERVAAANPKTVVVLNTGSPISMEWLDKVAAVVQAWFPGQEAGNAISDVLFGDTNPSGKLTQTYPKRLEDNPAYINYPGENGKVYYGEGLFVGYRYYDKKKITPLFPFGYGLSYTTFQYSNLRLDKSQIEAGDELLVSIDVTNTGHHAGKEVVQLYIRDMKSSRVRPIKELKGFTKVDLAPGETRTVSLPVRRESLAFYDDFVHQWTAEAGEFEVLVGASSLDIRATAQFRLTSTSRYSDSPKASVQLGIKSPLHILLGHDDSKAILVKHIPGLIESEQLGMAMGFTLEQLAGFAPEVFTTEVLQKIADELEQLSPVETSSLSEAPELGS